MNLALLDPSAQDYPETNDEVLEDGIGVVCAFNRRGTLLAVGCNDGRIVLWDFDTRVIARALVGHLQTITALCWSRNGRRLVSSSTDWTVSLWDVPASERIRVFKFDSPVLHVSLHSRNDALVLVNPLMAMPVLVNITAAEGSPASLYTRNNVVVYNPPLTEERRPLPLGADAAVPGPKPRSDSGVMAIFAPKGVQIYVGTPSGSIFILDSATLALEQTLKVSAGSGCSIKSIVFSRKGDYFIVNSMDKILRLYRTRDLELEFKFQDLVNREQWKACCFSNSGVYVIAASAQEMTQHHIYIWDREKGTLVRILEGPKTGVLDLAWHPGRPVIVSLSTYGAAHIWAVNTNENWSAFAPDFKELEENIEYIEREDEFDVVDESTARTDARLYDENVDILTIEALHFGSSDEEPIEDEFVYFASAPLEDVEPESALPAQAPAALGVNGTSGSDPRKRKPPMSSAAVASSSGGARAPPAKKRPAVKGKARAGAAPVKVVAW